MPYSGTQLFHTEVCMALGREIYEFLLAGAKSYAQWDLEVSTSIIKNRKKVLFLLALATPILVVCMAEA